MSEVERDVEKEVIRIFLPVIIRNLIRHELLEKDKLHDYDYIQKVISEHPYIIDELNLVIRIQHIVQSLDWISVRSTQGVFSTSCNYSDRPDHRANCLGTGSTDSSISTLVP